MIYVVMGVSGCGKTTVGKALAERINARFVDADDHHPQDNINKMRQGMPLDDDDRLPWLELLAKIINEHISTSIDLVLACSALKQKYRDALTNGRTDKNVRFIYLKCDINTIKKRMSSRRDHLMPPSLAESQFDDLEEPSGNNVLIVDGELSIQEIINKSINGFCVTRCG